MSGLAALVFLALILFYLFKPKVAGIYIDASPSSTVFINGEQVGTTPYRGTRDPGDVVLKIVPKDQPAIPITPYETKVSLLNGVETVIRYNFGPTDDMSSGEIISFEKIAKGETSLAIVSIPDSAEIVIDNDIKAFAPHKSSSIKPGDHTLVLSVKGYQDKTVRLKTHEGYKLTAIVTLARLDKNAIPVSITPTPSTASNAASATPTPIGGPSVLILQTSTGTLRVRKEAKTTSEEIGEVKSGENYPYLDRDTVTGWFKISFDGKEGWVSPQYAKKVEVKVSGTPTPSKTVSATPTKRPIITATPTPSVAPTIPG